MFKDFKAGGFDRMKWSSNSQDLLEISPESRNTQKR